MKADFYVTNRFIKKKHITFYEEDIPRVRELSAENKTFTALSNQGMLYTLGKIKRDDNESIAVEILNCEDVRYTRLPISLFFSMGRVNEIDNIFKYSSALGVSNVYPFFSDKISKDLFEEKELEKPIRLALKESDNLGYAYYPNYTKVLEFDQVLNVISESKQASTTYFLYELENTQTLSSSLIEKRPQDHVNIIIGNWVGFTKEHTDTFIRAGAIPVSIGGAVFKEDLAMIYALSIIRSVFLSK